MWRLVASFLITNSAFALGLHNVWLEYRSYDQGSRVATAPGYALTQGIGLRFEITQGIDLTGIGLPVRSNDRLFFWRNLVHGNMETGQFRTVGWQFDFGIRPFSWLEFSRYHHSQHLIDAWHPWPGLGSFPLEDGWMVRIRLAE